MNRGERQVIAEKISSTIRVLELLGFDYEVSAPRNERKKGNRSPRVVYISLDNGEMRVYNSVSGNTWANSPDGTPISQIKSVEDLYAYLSRRPKKRPRSPSTTRSPSTK
jgi:hypothetical protein